MLDGGVGVAGGGLAFHVGSDALLTEILHALIAELGSKAFLTTLADNGIEINLRGGGGGLNPQD